MHGCPLCSSEVHPYATDPRRSYLHCSACDLISADPASFLDKQAEKVYYDLHENSPDDAGYRRFLGRLATPLLARLSPGMEGLDHGCGPGPTLSVMMQEAGMVMTIHDPLYFPNPGALERSYDFVTCSEVVEHFRRPDQDWALLVSMLRPGGWLAIMTKLVLSRERFQTWHYKDDPTHLGFYSPATFAWLGLRFGLSVERIDRDVLFLGKPSCGLYGREHRER